MGLWAVFGAKSGRPADGLDEMPNGINLCPLQALRDGAAVVDGPEGDAGGSLARVSVRRGGDRRGGRGSRWDGKVEVWVVRSETGEPKGS